MIAKAAAALLLAVLALSGCASVSDVQNAPSPTPSPSLRCPETGLRAGEVPTGWEPELRPGAGGGSGAAAVGHWSGGQGRFVQVTRGRDFILATPTRSLTVLGEPAQAGAIHEGFGVDFRACQQDYQLQGYGITAADLNRLAESLQLDP